MVSNLFSRVLVGVPTAPITIGTTFTFIFHIFFSSSERPRYQSFQLPHYKVQQSQLFGIHFFLINNDQVRPPCSYDMVCLYCKIPNNCTSLSSSCIFNAKCFAIVIILLAHYLFLIPVSKAGKLAISFI